MAENRRTHRVQFGETDAAGIVFYPNYYRWFDAGTHELFRALGYPVVRMFEEGFAIPLLEAQARFYSAVLYDQEIVIISRVAEIRTRGLRIEHVVERDGETVCEGYEARAWIQFPAEQGNRAEPIPDYVRCLLSAP